MPVPLSPPQILHFLTWDPCQSTPVTVLRGGRSPIQSFLTADCTNGEVRLVLVYGQKTIAFIFKFSLNDRKGHGRHGRRGSSCLKT